MISISADTNSLKLMLKFFILLYILNKTHILNNLITIEFMAVAVTAATFVFMTWASMELYLVLFMMILMITESILGLSMLINSIRTHSNDYLKSSNLTKC